MWLHNRNRAKVKCATSYLLIFFFSIQLLSPVLFMQFVPQPFMFIHSSLNSVLKHLKPVGQRKQKCWGWCEWVQRPGLCYITTPYSTIHTAPDSFYLGIPRPQSSEISPHQHIQSYLSLGLEKAFKLKLTNKDKTWKNAKNATQNSGSGYDVSYSLGKWNSLYSINWPSVFCPLISVCYVTSCSPGEGLSNTSARPTIGGNHRLCSYFKHIIQYFQMCSFP